ncbi:MAG: hypothetical protein ABIJ95_08135 [Pseudomonadota bacterium]
MLRQLVNHRFNPFTAATAYSVITDEVHAIPGSGVYWARLFEVPDPAYADPTSGTSLYIRTTGGTVFTEVSGSPGLNEFRPDHTYKTGWVEFNSGNAGAAILACYRGTGSPITAELINALQWIEPAAAWFGGDGSDGDLTLSGNTNLDGVAGELCAFKQYGDLDLSGHTLGLSATNSPVGMVLNVSGTLTMDASSVIDVSGKGKAGGAGGTSGTPAGGPGAPGAYGAGGGGGADSAGGQGGGTDTRDKTSAFSSGAVGPGAGVGGYGGAPGNNNGAAGVSQVNAPPNRARRRLVNGFVPGAGGGGGAGVTGVGSGGAGGAGGGFLLIHCNVLVIPTATGVQFDASGANGSNGPAGGGGGGGAGGTIIILANRIVGASADNLQTTACDVSGGAGGTEYVAGTQGTGGAGADGVKRVVELYSYNVR